MASGQMRTGGTYEVVLLSIFRVELNFTQAWNWISSMLTGVRDDSNRAIPLYAAY